MNNKIMSLHFCHTWMHRSLLNSFKCIKCNAEVTDYQLQNYPFISYYKSDYYWYWYDVPCDEIWRRLKTTGYMQQRIYTTNPERVKHWLWDVRLVRDEGHEIPCWVK